MFKRTKIGAGVIAALGCTLLTAQVAQAQGSGVVDRVEVTGSRILTLGAESPSPLQVIGAIEIASSGVTNVQELLLKNPTFGTPAISRTNSNFSTASAGVATLDLRNLGTARTLVLVNGRRFVAGVPGDSAVDMNSIPTEFIERVEILTGGASSTYGSDAVAGVVNIILKRNFSGVSLDASKGRSSKGDDTKDKFSLTFGANSEGGKGNVMGHVAYSKQGAVFSRDRDASAVDQASVGAFITGDPADFFTVVRPFYSSFAPQGRFFVGTTNRTFDTNGNVIPFSTNGPAGDGVGATGFNRSAFRTIAIPTERFLLAGKGEYNLADGHSAFFEGTYAATQTKTQLEPFPLDSAGSGGIYPASGGRAPAEFMVGTTMVRNPVIPQALYNLMTDTNGDGFKDYGFSRRLSEVGNRGNVADRDTFRIATGLKGTFLKSWDYDAYVAYGATKESQVSGGQVNVLNFRNALEAVPDVNDINGNGNTAEAICRDAQARAQGCVPLNIFGFNTITPEMAKYISAPGLLSTFTSQKLYGATVSGEPFNLPAGPLGLAFGMEHREEYSRSEFDALQQAGLNAGNAIPRTEGKFSVSEFFAEARVPLLKDLPFIKSLQLTGAVRSGDYSTVGRTLSWNAGFEWKPMADLKLRATRALSTRAPNINELYSPPSQTFPTGLVDPCLGVTATSSGPNDANCRAEAGVAANIATNGAFTLNQSDLQGVSGFNRGNPALSEEKGRSTTLGLVYTPRALGNLTLTADYFKIDISDAIVSTPRQFILDQCYGGDRSFCQFIKRRAAPEGANSAGSLDEIDSAVTNSGGLFTEGVDLTVAWGDKLGPGRLNTRLAYTYVKEGYIIPLPGSDKDHFGGEVGGSKHKFSLTLGYNFGPFGIVSQTSYIGKAYLDDTFLKSYDLEPRSVSIGSKVYNDFQVTYNFRKAQFYIGIDNAFDTKAPPLISGLPSNTTGAETDASTYDAIGRRYYAGVRMSF
jgi:iron complex outermembrane receptor protein